MIPNEVETFTAKQAIDAELYDAIKRGETKFSGHYECGKGDLMFRQQVFTFTDSHKNFRSGKFIDVDEVLKFMDYIREREMKENV